MQIMKSSTTTIWESASRPLFVRSVWLETPKIGRSGPQRHFILDYEPKRQRRRSAHSKSAAPRSNSCRNKAAHATLQHSQSYDFVGDWRNHHGNQCELRESLPTDLLLIVPAKVEPLPAANATTAHTSQQQQQQQQKYTIRPPLQSSHRSPQKRPTIFFRNRAPHHGPLHELYELYSHHSSLQDLQSTLSQANSHADERLAERVLNWLDLAGKRVDIHQPKPPQQSDTQEMVKQPKKLVATKTSASATQPPRASTSVAVSNRVPRPSNAQAQNQSQSQSQSQFPSQMQMSSAASQSSARLSRKHGRYASATRAEQNITTAASTTSQMGQVSQVGRTPTSDAVKHITIIFDREGVPVRFNRPIRNIDLCTLRASPDTVRRLAGSLASARLYSGDVEQTPTVKTAPPKSLTSRHRSSNDLAHGAKAGKQKQTPDPCVFDAKKQLHIFMPNLPKKNLLNGCGSVDDTLSGLSNTFSELCKI